MIRTRPNGNRITRDHAFAQPGQKQLEKPLLIKPLGIYNIPKGQSSKAIDSKFDADSIVDIKGMYLNPETFLWESNKDTFTPSTPFHPTMKGTSFNPVTLRWEGNEGDLTTFDAPDSSHSTAAPALE